MPPAPLALIYLIDTRHEKKQGVESVLSNGVLAGFPVLGMKAVLVDGAFHDVDSSVMAFEIAGRAACREGLRKAGARLMEPIMQVCRCVLAVPLRTRFFAIHGAGRGGACATRDVVDSCCCKRGLGVG